MKHLFVIATGNPGKIRDFAHILGTENKEFKTLKDIGFTDDIVEDGDSFEANAIIKSSTVAKWLCEKHIEASVLADDSGLEVFALNGEPGIYSAVIEAIASGYTKSVSTSSTTPSRGYFSHRPSTIMSLRMGRTGSSSAPSIPMTSHALPSPK